MVKLKRLHILLAGLDQNTVQEITNDLSSTNLIFNYEYHRDDILHALELHDYDLVIVDASDHLSTFRICTQIRDELSIHDVPILVLAQEFSQTTIQAFKDIKVNLFIEKPVTGKKLRRVYRIISSSSSSSE